MVVGDNMLCGGLIIMESCGGGGGGGVKAAKLNGGVWWCMVVGYEEALDGTGWCGEVGGGGLKW